MWVGVGDLEVMPSGASTLTGWLKPSASSSLFVALGRGAVADADDVEVLAEAVGDTDDHVVDERAGQAVQGPVLALVVGALDEELVAVLADGDGAGQVTLERALGALHGDVLAGDGDVDAAGDGDGCASDA